MARWATYGIWTAVVVGVFFRSFHYIRQPSVWHDEAAVLVNVVDLDFAQLTGPLHFHEAAPVLFLWIERALFLTFGDHLLPLRFPAFLASCLSLLLLVYVARRWMSEAATFWVVLLFACCEKFAWHGCEAKPYALDVFATLAVLALYVRLEPLPLSRRCLLHAAVAPILLTLSYPACFVHGGLLLALLPQVWTAWTRLETMGYGLLLISIAGTFLGVVLPVAQKQHDPVIHSDWTKFFPDWDQPLSVVRWFVVNCAEVLRYCLHPHGQLLILPLAIGVVAWWRQQSRERVWLCLGPLLLALLAACLHRYPFGGTRVQLYAAPLVLLMSGAGLDAVLPHLRRKIAWFPLSVSAYLVVITLTYATRRVIEPWPRADTPAACAWIDENSQPGDVIHGNDWTHRFYLHRREEQFAFLPQTELTDAPRIWLVWTEQVDPDVREKRLLAYTPSGWRVTSRRDFDGITVILIVRTDEHARHD